MQPDTVLHPRHSTLQFNVLYSVVIKATLLVGCGLREADLYLRSVTSSVSLRSEIMSVCPSVETST
jgi:hypothetical protein